MSDRFPNLEDVSVPNVGGARPVAGYDVSPLAHGEQALASGVSNLGTGLEKAANTVHEYEQAKMRNQALLAQDSIIGDVLKAREDFRHDTDYDTLPDRWQKRVDGIVQNGIQNIPEGMARDHVMARLQRPLATASDQVREYAFNGHKQAAHAELYDRANNLVQATGPYDDPLHTARVNLFNSRANEYGQQGLLTPLEVQQHKQNLALHLADARARARIDLGPAEAAKVEQELRNSIPRGGSSTFPPGGWGPTDHAASVVADAETSDPAIGRKALGNISADAKGSSSYGFLGLNSGSGSVAAFVAQFGKKFGLTAQPGTAAFDQQWKDAANYQTADFRQAQLAYFNERIVPGISADLQRYGVPANVASDPRVVTYFADRQVQMGDVAKGNIAAAWNSAGGDPVRFMRNMNAIDGTPGELARNFRSAIASGVYGEAGHATRLRTRLEGALATGPAGQTPEAPAAQGDVPASVIHTVAPGETLGKIANQYGVSAEDIANDNEIHKEDQLQTGAQLTIRPAAGSLTQEQAPRGYTGNPLFAKLTPQHRDALIAHAQQAQHQYRTQASVQLQAGIKDDLAAATRDGYVPKGRSLDDFVRVYGDEQGRQQFNGYVQDMQAAQDAHSLSGMPPEEQAALVSLHRPTPGEPGYTEKAQRFDNLARAAGALNKQLTDDPAGYMIRYSPPVQQGWQAVITAADPRDQAKAAQTYAATMIAEQKRFGVAPENIKVVPDVYADNFRTNVTKLVEAGNGNQLIPLLKTESDRWGSAWPEVYRQVTAGDPLLTVVGAGVKPAAGQLLAANAKVKFGDIVKDEQSAKAKDIRESVDTAMAPFASSIVASASGVKVYNDVRGQIEKLAALYSFQHGMTAEDAAKQATDDVLNFKYDYRDGYRIPNANDTRPAGVSADDIQIGAAAAKANLGGSVGGLDLKVRPHLDTFGGAYTPEQLAAETADAKRYGRWATNSDETGLVFVYGYQADWKRQGYQVVRRPDGSPLQFTWKQLADLGGRTGSTWGWLKSGADRDNPGNPLAFIGRGLHEFANSGAPEEANRAPVPGVADWAMSGFDRDNPGNPLAFIGRGLHEFAQGEGPAAPSPPPSSGPSLPDFYPRRARTIAPGEMLERPESGVTAPAAASLPSARRGTIAPGDTLPAPLRSPLFRRRRPPQGE